MFSYLLLLLAFPTSTFSQSLCSFKTPGAGANTVDCLCGAPVSSFGTDPPQTLCSLTPNANGMITGRYCTDAASRCDEVPTCVNAFATSPLTVGVHTLAYPGCAITHTDGLHIGDIEEPSSTTPITIITGVPEAATGKLPMLSGGHVNRLLYIDGPLTLTDVRLVRGRTGQCTCNWTPHESNCENCGNGVNVGGWPSVGARICNSQVNVNDLPSIVKCSGGLIFLGKGARRSQDQGGEEDFSNWGQDKIFREAKECFLNSLHAQCSNTNVLEAVKVLKQSERRELIATRVTFEYGVAYQAGAVMVQHGRLKCTDCEMLYNIVKPQDNIGTTGVAGAVRVDGTLSRLELVGGDIHHNEAFDGGGIYIEGNVHVWQISNTNIRDNVAPAEGTSNFVAAISSQWPRYCVTDKNTGVLDTSVAIWNNKFESRNENECPSKSSNHRWVWPGFNFCPQGKFMTGTRSEKYEANIFGCPNFCASGKYSGTDAGFRISCPGACPVGAYCPAGSILPTPCPGGKYGTLSNQFLVTSCRDCLSGFFTTGDSPRNVCETCPKGYTQLNSSSSYCLPCSPGKFENSNSCDACNKGKFQSDSSQSECKPCSTGRYQNQTGQALCLPCIPGKYMDAIGEVVRCKDCDVNFISKDPSAVVCVSCAAGKQSDAGSAKCQSCEAGTYSNDAGENCKVCIPGQYRSGSMIDATLCETCGVGEYQPKPGQTSCLRCGAGMYQPLLAKGTVCIKCEAGRYRELLDDAGVVAARNNGKEPGKSCEKCLPGYYTGLSDAPTPIPVTGRPFCLGCDAGKYAKLEESTSCTTCPYGKFESEKRATTECRTCETGLVPDGASSGSTTCIAPVVDSLVSDVRLLRIAPVNSGLTAQLFVEIARTENAKKADAASLALGVGDLLLVEVSTRTDFFGAAVTTVTPSEFTVASTTPALVKLSLTIDVVLQKDEQGIQAASTLWHVQQYYRMQIVKKNSKRGAYSIRNDAWETASKCGNEMYLLTHEDDGSDSPPLPLYTCLGVRCPEIGETSQCRRCPFGSDCTGELVWNQVGALSGYRPLPWDRRAFGQCPTVEACPATNQTTSVECLAGHRGELCAMCLDDWTIGFGKPTCVQCPPLGDTTSTIVGLAFLSLFILAALVYDSLDGIKMIIEGVAAQDSETLQLGQNTELSAANIEKLQKLQAEAQIPFHSVAIRIISSYMQVAGLLANFNLKLPEAITSLVSVQSGASGIGAQIISFDCLLPNVRGYDLEFTKQLAATIVAPLVLCVGVVLFWVVYSLICGCGGGAEDRSKENNPKNNQDDKNQDKNQENLENALPKSKRMSTNTMAKKKMIGRVRVSDKMVGSLIVLFYLMFPSILNSITGTLACTRFGPDEDEMTGDQYKIESRVLLDSAPSIICYQGKHMAMLGMISIPGFLLFVVLIPLYVVLAMRYYLSRCELHPVQKAFNPRVSYRYGFLFLGYRPSFFFWEVVVMVRKAAFVVAAGVLRPYGPVSQVIGAVCILLVSLSLNLQYLPYEIHGHDNMESFSLHCSLFILMAVLMAAVVTNNIDGSFGPTSSVVTVICVFAATVVVVLIFVWQILRHSHAHPGVLGTVSKLLSKKPTKHLKSQPTFMIKKKTSVTPMSGRVEVDGERVASLKKMLQEKEGEE